MTIPISSDIESFARQLWWWEHAEYVFAALVTIACFGEYLADFGKRQWIISRKEVIAKGSTLLLIAALSLELICLVRTNEISGRVIGSLGDMAQEAEAKARRAIGNSSTALSQANDALSKAGAAQQSLEKAEDEANKAQTASSSALSLARGAREEVASLETEALKLRKELALQGGREKLLAGDDRRKLVIALRRFAGQKIDVRYSANAFMADGTVMSSSPVGDDTVAFAKALVGVMQDAGWILPSTPLLYDVQGYGINVEIVENASPATRGAARGLVAALKRLSLIVSDPQTISAEGAKRVGTAAQALSPPLGDNTIILGVLTHP